ncbi:hypothetical protein BJY00DRAFT_295175 [Aspergillus carlsbadensis]|nr:hypothetical protein BJY00DRAFT_295175 [Aspergillus carlsbadensis]
MAALLYYPRLMGASTSFPRVFAGDWSKVWGRRKLDWDRNWGEWTGLSKGLSPVAGLSICLQQAHCHRLSHEPFIHARSTIRPLRVSKFTCPRSIGRLSLFNQVIRRR